MTDADEVLGRILTWATREESVRALILMGSRARADAPADEWSDTDLAIITTDADRWLRDETWLAEIGPAPIESGGGAH